MVVAGAFLECKELLIYRGEAGLSISAKLEKEYCKGRRFFFTLPFVSGSTSHMIGIDRRGGEVG